VTMNPHAPYTDHALPNQSSGLSGRWTGTALNRSINVHLDLEVDSEGRVSGSGVRSVWSLESDGRVSGSGSFTFIVRSSQIVSSAKWDLLLDENEAALTGSFHVSHVGYGKLLVQFRKKGK